MWKRHDTPQNLTNLHPNTVPYRTAGTGPLPASSPGQSFVPSQEKMLKRVKARVTEQCRGEQDCSGGFPFRLRAGVIIQLSLCSFPHCLGTVRPSVRPCEPGQAPDRRRAVLRPEPPAWETKINTPLLLLTLRHGNVRVQVCVIPKLALQVPTASHEVR